MSGTDLVEAKLLRWTLGDTSIFSNLAACYGALYTVLPDDSGAGGTEVSAGGYARQNLSGKFGTLSAITNGAGVSNASQILWGPATANWGTIVGVGIIDASSGAGTLGIIRVTALASGIPINSGGSFFLDPGDWTLRTDA